MAYTPENYKAQDLDPGTHQVYLIGLEQITDSTKLAKFGPGTQAVFIATFKAIETAIEKGMVIKFNGTKADFYAGQNIDRLHLAAGLSEPEPGSSLDLAALLIALDGVMLLLEVNDRGYASTILVPESHTGTEGIPF
jgi:hypothetical protein